MERKLINYLPIFIQEYAEIKAIMDAEQVTIENTWSDSENVLKDQFVPDATENGVKRWESILNLVPKATYTLDERKFNILARLNEQLPYTLETLKNMLATMCGDDGYTVKMDYNNYMLLVKLSLSNENNIGTVKDLLCRVVPANIITSVSLFNTHGALTPYTHGYLSAYTHRQTREENL